VEPRAWRVGGWSGLESTCVQTMSLACKKHWFHFNVHLDNTVTEPRIGGKQVISNLSTGGRKGGDVQFIYKFEVMHFRIQTEGISEEGSLPACLL
jgi:hypothetical protein